MEHKHASVLRAIADGVPLSEFEFRGIGPNWMCLSESRSCDWVWEIPNTWEIRRKPQYIMVNGFKVPKPLDVVETGCYYWLVGVLGAGPYPEMCENINPQKAKEHCRTGLVHATKEAAIAHAKAMLGIDPKLEE